MADGDARFTHNVTVIATFSVSFNTFEIHLLNTEKVHAATKVVGITD